MISLLTYSAAPGDRPDVLHSASLFAVLDASSSAVIGMTSDGRINYVNPRAVHTFGYPVDQLLGQLVEVLVPEERAARHVQLREAYVVDPHPRAAGPQHALWGRRKDGTTFPVEISLTPLPTDEGPWVIAGIVDVSERRAVEDRLSALSRAHLALAELNAAILRARTPEELLEEACRVVTGPGQHLGAWVGEPGEDGAVVPVAHAGKVGAVAGLPALTDVITDGVAWFCADLLAETSGAWKDWAIDTGMATVVVLPLRRRGQPVATLTICDSQPGILDDELRAVLLTVADNLSFALDRYDTRARIHQIDDQRVRLLGRLVAAQEEERSRIAGDVHDHSIQALAALDLRLGMIRQGVLDAAPELAGSMDLLQSGLAAVTAGLRDLLYDLETAAADVSLMDQLQDALDHVFEQSAVAHSLDVAPYDGQLCPAAELDPDLSAQAVRIFKEALANVRQHSQASGVQVTVTPDELGIEFAVADDGVGPQADVATLRSAHGHRGLDGMRDRAEVAGGWCRLERADGSTTLRFWLPRAASPATA